MHRSRRTAIGAVVVGSFGLSVIGASPALANTHYAHLSASELAHSRPAAPPANLVSHTFGGWVFAKAGQTTVTSVFTMPASIACTKTQSGVSPGSFMITGTKAKQQFNGAGVFIECLNGQPAAAADAIIDLNEKFDPSDLLSGGDQIRSTVTTTATATTATMTDLTQHFTFTDSGPATPALQEMIEDDSAVTSNPNGKQLPVANFGQISFSNGLVGGKSLGSVTPRSPVNMETTANVLQIQTDPLTGAKLNMFTTVFKHA